MQNRGESNHCLRLALGNAERGRSVEELVSLLGEFYPVEECSE